MHELRAIPSTGNRVSGAVGVGRRNNLRAAVCALAAIGSFIAAEAIARLVRSGVADLFAFVLCLLGFQAAYRAQRLRPNRFLSGCGAVVARVSLRLAAKRPRYGLDLREKDAAPKGLPASLKLATTVALSAAVFSLTFAPDWTDVVLAAAESTVDLVRVVFRGSLATTLSILVAKSLVDAILSVESIGGERRARWVAFTTWLTAAVIVLFALIATILWPIKFAFGLVVVALCGTLIASTRRSPALRVFWTAEGEGRGVADFSDILACRSAIAAAVPIILAQLAGAGQADESGPNPPADLLPHFAAFYVWITVAALAARTAAWSAYLKAGIRRDPARPVPISVLIGGPVSPAQRTLWVELLGREGHRVRFENAIGSPPDVTIGEEERRRSFDLAESKFGEFSVAMLDSAARERVVRRAEIRRRRGFYRGIEKLFKCPGRAGPGAAGGTWFALQHWFAGGLMRGDLFCGADPIGARRKTSIVGPNFDRAFSAASRAHYHDVMSALDLDLVYIDEGTDKKALIRAFSVVFEYYDMWNGRRTADERFLFPPTGVSLRIVEIDALRTRAEVQGSIFCGVARARVLVVGPSRDGNDRKTPRPNPRMRRPVGTSA